MTLVAGKQTRIQPRISDSVNAIMIKVLFMLLSSFLRLKCLHHPNDVIVYSILYSVYIPTTNTL